MKLLVVSLCFAAMAWAQVTPPPPKPAWNGASPGASTARPVYPQQPPPSGPSSAEQRLSYAQQAFGLAHSMYRAGNISADAAATWSLRIYEAQKDSAGPATAAKEHLERMIALEKLAVERVQSGAAPVLDKMTVAWFRAQAEILTGKK